jgi:hypothetical protein
MICAHRSLYRNQGGGCCRFNPLAASQGGGGGGLCSAGSGDFFRHHAPAFHVSRRTASTYAGQAHCDHTLRVKTKAPHVVPKFPGGVHLASPKVAQVLNEPRHPLFGSEAGRALIAD